MPPQINATLTSVTGATAATRGRDDWDEALADNLGDDLEPPGAGADKWTGTADAYYRENVQRTPDGTTIARTLYIDTAAFDLAGIDTDDVLTFTTAAGPVTARARLIAPARLAGIPPSLQTTRLELELAGT